MKEVYVVNEWWDYEGERTIAVFTTRYDALDFAHKITNYSRSHGYRVHRMELNHPDGVIESFDAGE